MHIIRAYPGPTLPNNGNIIANIEIAQAIA
jgi:hypothetical protein